MSNLKSIIKLASFLAILGLLVACAPQTAPSMGMNTANGSSMMSNGKEASYPTAQAGLGAPTVQFSLKTGGKDGKMVFFGVGGAIDGKVNPDLAIKPGDIVEITLIAGDAVQHDLVLPDFNVGTQKVSAKGVQVKVTFKAEKEGTYAYFCSVPGHRAAGMEGKLIVGTPPAIVEQQFPSISRSPSDLPGPLNRSTSEKVVVNLETVELMGRLADGTGYDYYTFNGKVPGPFLRVRVGDTVEVHLKNKADSSMIHSVDFHAVTGPGGGAVMTQTKPGEETMFTFKALNPGLFVYHCATPMVAHHITNGMYGLILVEPEGGLPAVDREFYVMQGEIYTEQAIGIKGSDTFSEEKLLDEQPTYFVFNGAVGALTAENPLKAKVGETVRIFFGVGGPNFTSSFHVIGEIFDKVYDQASLTSEPLTNVQTTVVPPGGATVVDFKLQVPGRFILVDHALSRMERGLAGYLLVDGPAAPDIYNGQMTAGSGH